MQTELFDYGADVHVEAPPPDEVFVPPTFSDLEQLEAGRGASQ